MSKKPAIDFSQQQVADFCRKNHIRRLSIFGSALRSDFGPDSDVDVLVEFDPDHLPGYIGLAGMELELAEILGRKVDLNTPNMFSRYFHNKVP